jgi:hypothetical protein
MVRIWFTIMRFMCHTSKLGNLHVVYLFSCVALILTLDFHFLNAYFRSMLVCVLNVSFYFPYQHTLFSPCHTSMCIVGEDGL